MIVFVAVTSGIGIALLGHPAGAIANDAPQADAANAADTTSSKAPSPATAAAQSDAPEQSAEAKAPQASGAATAQQPPADPEAMVARLAERLEKEPNDAEGWQMLGRSYTVMDRPADAVKAYRQLVKLKPDDSQALSDLGRAIGHANGRRINEEAETLLNKALQKDNGNVMAHALLGKTELERGQPLKAREHWEAALAALDPQHPFADSLRSAIKMTEPRATPAAPDTATTTPPAASASSSTTSTTTAAPKRH
ncbi:MAG: hypothetical protein WAQ08_07080 [Aquabacterium sp.]